jgi:hypothetical protein
VCLDKALHAQYVYTIKADSVKITNTCDTAELIIENHTQNVPGFLFNKGRGRTEFRRGLTSLNESVFLIGADTLDLDKILGGRFYKQGGNSFGTTALLGTKDDYPLTFIQNGIEKGRIDTSGHWLFHTTEDNGFPTQFKGDIWQAGALFQDKNVNIIPIGGVFGDARINIGSGNVVTGHAAVALGSAMRVTAAGVATVGIGWDNTVYDGVGILGSTDRGIAIGIGSYAGENAIALGAASHTTANNQFVCGGPDHDYESPTAPNKPIANVFFGSGVQRNNLPGPGIPYTINGSGAFGTDYAGGNITIAGGKGTGSATPGSITFSLANTTSSGSTLQSLFEKARIAGGSGNFLINTSTDNGDKLQVIGNVFANGNQHKMGNLAIVSGADVGNSGFATGIRIDNSSYGSFIFQGTNQGSANDMFVFTDAYGGIGQDIINPDQSLIRIKSGIRSNNTVGNSANMLNIQPEYNLNPAISNPLTMRGIYYNPKLTSVISGSKHIAIETVTGDVLLGTTSGNIGMGTNSPTAQLHTTGSVRFGGLTSNNSLTRMVVSDANGNLYYKEDSSSGAFNGSINSDLAVNGRISAQKMLITQTGRWPDYVFSKHYTLPALSEVENFIKRNNHLPGIPSAAEVEKKGIDVGDNQANLLKKIEELILYAIEQEKKIQKQSEDISELKNKNKELELLKQQMAELKALIQKQ